MPVRRLPFAAIRDSQDRGATARLLARLATAGVRAPRWVVATLACLEDPRAEAPLQAMLRDTSLSEDVRSRAGSLLREQDAVTRSEARALLRSDDIVLRRHAVLALGPEDGDVLRTLADAPSDPCHRDALTAMECGFDAPADEARKIAGLSHPDPDVRVEAAGVLLWDEPVAAEGALVEATADRVATVAVAAANTLRYYRTRRVLLHLERLGRRRGRLGREARSALDELVYTFADAVAATEGPARETLEAWTAPVAHLLARAMADAPRVDVGERPATLAKPLPLPRVDEPTLRGLLDDPDGSWAPKLDLLRRVDPACFDDEARRRLAPWLTRHPDPTVRDAASSLLAAWDDREALLQLAGDPRRAVAKSATHALASTTPSAEVAHAVLSRLDSPGTTGVAAAEALRTVVAHLPGDAVVSWLVRRAREDGREEVRVAAVRALDERDAADAVASLADRLAAPPQVTWGLHVVLIEAIRRLGVPLPDVAHLRAVDHLDVQLALA